MKVLFAVSNENVSNKIVDSYRNKYRENISFKKVFYFNAIIKEIQKDKSYDRIVISEDLEPFSNSNYDVIDRFILERLQDITYENTNLDGRKMDIVIICTDRRTKSSYMLSKMYEMGIYNALIGQDRRIDNVCDLLYNPRTAEEAKEYYKIDNMSSEANKIDDVSEQEVQNILIHYKKLGKNEDRYADSFNNIASQYTDNQLKIIIKCLPINVRAILEAECPKYQELVTYSDETEQEKKQKEKIQEQRKLEQFENDKKLRSRIEKEKREAIRNAQRDIPLNQTQVRSGIDLLDNKNRQARMTGNVVIPDSMDVRNERKLYSDDELNQTSTQNRNFRMGDIQTHNTQQQIENTNMQNTLPGFDDIESNSYIKEQENVMEQDNENITLPGFEELDEMLATPETSTMQNNIYESENTKLEEPTLPGFDDIELPKPPTMQPQIMEQQAVSTQPVQAVEQANIARSGLSEASLGEELAVPQKRGRGRPRKYPVAPPKPKGKRGRPRKNPLPEDVQMVDNKPEEATLPGLEDMVAMPERAQGINDINNITSPELPGADLFEEDVFVATQPVTQNVATPTLPGFDNEFQDIQNDNNQDFSETIENNVSYDEDPIFSSITKNENYNNEQTIETKKDAVDDLFGLGDTPLDAYTVKPQQNQEVSTNMKNNNPFDTLPGFDDIDETATSYSPSQDRMESIQKLEENKSYTTGSLDTVLTKDKKIVAFVGAGKSGTSFLINNLACLFSSIGVKTAILDMTKNKNSYYIYTNNDENLRNIAYTSIEKLETGIAEGIQVDRNLNVYTALPNDGKDYSNSEAILSTLAQNESLILIDCDFDTDLGYFANSQEIYLVQSMDILTIQPLTAFLRDLKTKGILDQEKLRVVINKELKVRSLSTKAVIGGMSFYNDPAMSYMTELFSKEKIKACTIPFDENVYSKYLEAMVNCSVSINGYNKNFMNTLKILGNMVYPLLSKQTYSSKTPDNGYGRGFSNEMNSTLNQMKNKF